MHKLPALARLSSVSALFLLSSLCFGQRPAPRIRGPVERSPSVTLQGSLNPHIRTAEDLGPLAPDAALHGVTLVFKRSEAQEADLQQLLAQQADPSSPLYRHWLTPGEFATRFGLADSDMAAAATWLQSHGFTIDDVSRNRDRITFSGTAAHIHEAFGAELHRFRSGSESHFAPVTELSLPPSLAPVTAAVLHLSDFRPKPNLRAVHPDYTTLASQSHFLAPGDIATMYNMGPLKVSANNTPGWGQSVAIVGQSYVPTAVGSALYNFETLVAKDYNIFPVLVPGTGTEAAYPGDEGEANIDLEYSSGIAPSANIFYVFTGSAANYDVFDALAYAIAQDIAPVISVSYSSCEPLVSTTDLQNFNAILQQGAAQGQTIVVASGDSGPTSCAPYSATDGVSVTQQQALAVEFPASSPYVTAVGGTQMTPGSFTAGTSTYWSSASNTDSIQSLLSYVPEVVWNEDSPSFGITASGGGSSTFFARPSWQTGVPGIPSGAFRLVPDIALESSISDPGYIMCTDDHSFTGASSDCAGGNLKDSNNRYILAGGTSFAAPIFAGFVAVLNQYEQTMGLGNLNPTLYSLAAQPSVYTSAFHDITAGTTACAAGDGNCGTPGKSAYAATTGYDQATGLGSLDFSNLATAWPSTTNTGLAPTATSFSYTQLNASAGATVSVQILVGTGPLAAGATLPTGSLSLWLDGTMVNAALPLGAGANQQGSVNYSFVAPSQTGSHIVLARYNGDATHLPSSAAYVVTVGNVLATGNVSLSAQNLTVANNNSNSTQLTITPTGGYSGELTWSLAVTGGSPTEMLCYVIDAPRINGPATGTLHIGSGTACSAALPAGSVSPSTVQRTSIQKASPLPSRKAPAAATFLALLLCGVLPSRGRRKLLPVLSACILAVVALTVTGCGGTSGSVAGGSGTGTGSGGGSGSGSGSGSGTTNPNPQVYALTLTAHDSVNTLITSSTTFNLTVD